MKTLTILTFSQTLIFRYNDYSKLDLIRLKKESYVETLKKQLLNQGFAETSIDKPLINGEKTYHLIN